MPAACPNCGASVSTEARFCSQCGANVEQAQPSEPVSVRLRRALGKDYEIMGELGRGGFAVVYSVRDTRLNRYLAVKVMREEFVMSPETVERFQREAQIAAKLQHPNILSVTFAGEGHGLVYYAMPRVKGYALKDLLKKEEEISVDRATQIFRDVAHGLSHAHDSGVIHRDIKPANVMLENSGNVLILDFGIAKGLSSGGGSLTMTGQAVGTAQYMSPEQAAGDKTLDERADIYSLGVIGFEMLTGRTPFAGSSTLEIVARRMAEETPSVRTIRPDVPQKMADVISRCLEKLPERRWGSASEMLAYLD